MDTKQQLVENIKQWIKNDNEIRQLQAEVKKRKDNKKILSEKLVEVMSCLLYTSPSPRDGLLSRMPSSA